MIFSPQPRTSTNTPFPLHSVRQTVFNKNHWPVDVSAALWGISSVQTLSLYLSPHTREHKHTEKIQTQSIIQDSCFGPCVCVFLLLFLFCCFYSILWQPNSQEAQWARYEAWWVEVCVCLCNLDARVLFACRAFTVILLFEGDYPCSFLPVRLVKDLAWKTNLCLYFYFLDDRNFTMWSFLVDKPYNEVLKWPM